MQGSCQVLQAIIKSTKSTLVFTVSSFILTFLITGQDILSDTPGLVPLNCNGQGGSWHWITDYGSYNTKTRKFTPAPGVTVSGDQLQSYIKSTNAAINSLQKYSKYILDKDYYRKVFPNG